MNQRITICNLSIFIQNPDAILQIISKSAVFIFFLPPPFKFIEVKSIIPTALLPQIQRIGGVMVSVLTSSQVDRGFEP